MTVSATVLRTQTKGIRPQFEYEVDTQRRAVQTPPGSTQWRGRQINERALRRYRLVWDDTNEGQRRLLELAFEAAFGSILPMDYTPLEDVDANKIQVRFVEDTLEVVRKSVTRYSIRVEIEEVL